MPGCFSLGDIGRAEVTAGAELDVHILCDAGLKHERGRTGLPK